MVRLEAHNIVTGITEYCIYLCKIFLIDFFFPTSCLLISTHIVMNKKNLSLLSHIKWWHKTKLTICIYPLGGRTNILEYANAQNNRKQFIVPQTGFVTDLSSIRILRTFLFLACKISEYKNENAAQWILQE